MNYIIRYAGTSHTGVHCNQNQDNIFCANRYMNAKDRSAPVYYHGYIEPGSRAVFGVFDGMGGTSCGEEAALIAAKSAGQISLGHNPVFSLYHYCKQVNEKIRTFVRDNRYHSSGTTAALLAFSEKQITLCNIGNSKIFLLSGNDIDQISKDHTMFMPNRKKPLLTQNLGMDERFSPLSPYFATGNYFEDGIYLICSDGLSDILSADEIKQTIKCTPFETAPLVLQEKAFSRGARDDVSIILCKTELKRIFKGGKYLGKLGFKSNLARVGV